MDQVAERPSTALPNAWIDTLFDRLAMVYGTEKVVALWRGQDLSAVKAYWSRKLAHLTREQLAAGFKSLRGKHPSWPPTLLEFIDLCAPASPSIDPEVAFHEAVRGVQARRNGEPGEWSHRAVFWAMQDVTPFDLLNLTWPQIRSRWIRALEARLADPNLPQIPEPPKQLTHSLPLDKPNLQRLAAIAAKVGADHRSNPRAWVDKIFERKAAGDSSLSDIAYRMALDSVNIR